MSHPAPLRARPGSRPDPARCWRPSSASSCPSPATTDSAFGRGRRERVARRHAARARDRFRGRRCRPAATERTRNTPRRRTRRRPARTSCPATGCRFSGVSRVALVHVERPAAESASAAVHARPMAVSVDGRRRRRRRQRAAPRAEARARVAGGPGAPARRQPANRVDPHRVRRDRGADGRGPRRQHRRGRGRGTGLRRHGEQRGRDLRLADGADDHADGAATAGGLRLSLDHERHRLQLLVGQRLDERRRLPRRRARVRSAAGAGGGLPLPPPAAASRQSCRRGTSPSAARGSAAGARPAQPSPRRSRRDRARSGPARSRSRRQHEAQTGVRAGPAERDLLGRRRYRVQRRQRRPLVAARGQSARGPRPPPTACAKRLIRGCSATGLRCRRCRPASARRRPRRSRRPCPSDRAPRTRPDRAASP